MSTIISMFAAWLIIASPAMACCLTGHMDEAVLHPIMEVTSPPPCHQSQDATQDTDETETAPEKFCPSCDDCAVSPANYHDITPAPTLAPDVEILAILQSLRPVRAADIRLPDSTAPPPRSGPPVDKPLFTTDSLLI